MSGLYFRGKLAYSAAFAAPPDGMPGSLVIAAGRGLLPPSTVIGLSELCAIAEVPVDLGELRYREALERDAVRLHQAAGPDSEIVLLGVSPRRSTSIPCSTSSGRACCFRPSSSAAET